MYSVDLLLQFQLPYYGLSQYKRQKETVKELDEEKPTRRWLCTVQALN